MCSSNVHMRICILVKISKLPLDFVLLRSIISNDNILTINFNVFKNRTRTILRLKMVYVWIGFYIIDRLNVIYSDTIFFQCLLMLNVSYDVTQIVISGCLEHFRLKSSK